MYYRNVILQRSDFRAVTVLHIHMQNSTVYAVLLQLWVSLFWDAYNIVIT